MLKSVYILLLFSTSSIVSSSSCWSYKCVSGSANCITPSAPSHTYLISPCSPLRPFCDTSSLLQNVSCSSSELQSSSKSYPGEPCSSHQMCKFGQCISQTCYGQVLNERCSSHLECNPGLRCSNNICTTLLKPGKRCVTDFDCISSCGCNQGLCVAYYSLPLNSFVSDCTVDSGSSLFCDSGSCYYDNKKQTGICIGSFVSLKAGKICQSPNDCPAVSGKYTKYNDCQCGMNFNGSMFCSASEGDKIGVAYRNNFKEFIQAGKTAFCNTQRRFDKACIDISAGSYLYEKFIVTYIEFQNFAQLQNISDCVKTVFFPELSFGTWVLAPVFLALI